MGSPLRLVHRDGSKKPITAQEFIDDLFSEEKLDKIEIQTLEMRETFQARAQIDNHEEFSRELYRFHAHVQAWFNGTNNGPARINQQVNQQVVLNDLTRWYGQPLHEAERNAFYMRDGGGFIGVINKMTESILGEQRKAYANSVFFDYLPIDQDVRIRLAEELLKHYGDRIYTGPDIKMAAIMAGNIEEFIMRFVSTLRPQRRLLRW